MFFGETLFMMKRTTATTVFNDQHIMIETGVDISAVSVSSIRTLTNAIKITAQTRDEVHFVQFVTHQYPDLFSFNMSREASFQWCEVDKGYMTDNVTPKWKLDIVYESLSSTNFNTTIYYEEKGACEKRADFTAMMDYPGGMFAPEEERFVFCTFIVVNSQVTHLVKWSKQFNEQRKEFYSVDCKACDALPYWATSLLTQQYGSLIQGDRIFLGLRKTDRPSTPEAESLELRQSFLTPPGNWCTYVEYPALFSVATVPGSSDTAATPTMPTGNSKP